MKKPKQTSKRGTPAQIMAPKPAPVTRANNATPVTAPVMRANATPVQTMAPTYAPIDVLALPAPGNNKKIERNIRSQQYKNEIGKRF